MSTRRNTLCPQLTAHRPLPTAERRKFLMLDGASRLGKTAFAVSLVEAAAALEVAASEEAALEGERLQEGRRRSEGQKCDGELESQVK